MTYNPPFLRAAALFIILFFFLTFPAQAGMSYDPFKEYYLLHKYSKYLKKDKKGYKVYAENGKIIELQDEPYDGGDSATAYYLKDYLSPIGYFVFAVGYYEEYGYELINKKTGEIFFMGDNPNLYLEQKIIISFPHPEWDHRVNLYKILPDRLEEIKVPDNLFSYDQLSEIDISKKAQDKAVADLISKFLPNSGMTASNKLTIYNDEDSFEKRFPDIRSYFGNKKLVLSLLAQENADVQYIDKKLLDDEEVMKAAVKTLPKNAQYASPRLRNSPYFMNFVLEINPMTFRYASEELRDDRDFAIKAVGKMAGNFAFLSPRLRADEELAKIALAQDEEQMENISPQIKAKIKSSRDFTIGLIKSNCRVFIKLPQTFRDDEEIFWIAVNSSCRAPGDIFASASPRIKDNKQIVEMLMTKKPDSTWAFFENMSERLKTDQQFFIKMIKSGQKFGYSEYEKFQDDEEVIKVAIVLTGVDKMQYASERLKNNLSFMNSAIEINPMTFQYASEELRGNKNLALKAINANPRAFFFASKAIRSDRDLIMRLISSSPWIMNAVPNDLQGDKEFILSLIDRNPQVFEYLSSKLREDNQIKNRRLEALTAQSKTL